ncbi:hypothetical protein TNCV_2907351 [Trichonephila clavipes]|nr:hypothetical protein TNCV_2907351 [Trichonephila clavipes]
MSTLKNSMLELAAKFDDNYNTGLIKSFMFGLNKTEIKIMTDILSRYKIRDSHVRRCIIQSRREHGCLLRRRPSLLLKLKLHSSERRDTNQRTQLYADELIVVSRANGFKSEESN